MLASCVAQLSLAFRDRRALALDRIVHGRKLRLASAEERRCAVDLLLPLVETAIAVRETGEILCGPRLRAAQPLELALDVVDERENILVGAHRVESVRRLDRLRRMRRRWMRLGRKGLDALFVLIASVHAGAPAHRRRRRRIGAQRMRLSGLSVAAEAD
jgi:hypothetical protein